jgi:hypothetical protein
VRFRELRVDVEHGGFPARRAPKMYHLRVRQTHRWVSIAFTVGVIVNIVNIVAVLQQKYTGWVGLLALLPLVLLLFTGLYLFALPYATKWRSGQRSG